MNDVALNFLLVTESVRFAAFKFHSANQQRFDPINDFAFLGRFSKQQIDNRSCIVQVACNQLNSWIL